MTMTTTAATDENDRRWAAVTACDASADGSFVYGVRTTGVYCRPSCRGRTPRRANVSFHATPA
ncbi:MAG: bifunctional transcriptional activator/DNA repair enzyme protein Ada, partial [Caulobacterales bacterium]|nr:bifunctional transcriptional activator/DNA repair enzyme protein Ada [Caulobacterales bacterium]